MKKKCSLKYIFSHHLNLTHLLLLFDQQARLLFNLYSKIHNWVLFIDLISDRRAITIQQHLLLCKLFSNIPILSAAPLLNSWQDRDSLHNWIIIFAHCSYECRVRTELSMSDWKQRNKQWDALYFVGTYKEKSIFCSSKKLSSGNDIRFKWYWVFILFYFAVLGKKRLIEICFFFILVELTLYLKPFIKSYRAPVLPLQTTLSFTHRFPVLFHHHRVRADRLEAWILWRLPVEEKAVAVPADDNVYVWARLSSYYSEIKCH